MKDDRFKVNFAADIAVSLAVALSSHFNPQLPSGSDYGLTQICFCQKASVRVLLFVFNHVRTRTQILGGYLEYFCGTQLILCSPISWLLGYPFMGHWALERPVTRSGVSKSEPYKFPAAVLCSMSSFLPKEGNYFNCIYIFSNSWDFLTVWIKKSIWFGKISKKR